MRILKENVVEPLAQDTSCSLGAVPGGSWAELVRVRSQILVCERQGNSQQKYKIVFKIFQQCLSYDTYIKGNRNWRVIEVRIILLLVPLVM